MIICESDEIRVRKLTKNLQDMRYILKWLNNKKVSKYYGGIKDYTINEIIEKYSKKVDEKELTACIIELDEKPIGYLQFYNVNNETYEISKLKYKEIVKDNQKAVAIDLFLGDDNSRDKGIGTKTIKMLIATLFNQYKTDVILIDPKINNERAIKCYKKCGFKECFVIKEREEMNGILYDNLIMKIENKR